MTDTPDEAGLPAPIPADLTDPRVPWEPQPGEGPEAFQAFALYRDLGPQRSLAKVAAALGKSIPLMSRWSRTHNWGERRDAYDLYRDRRERAATESAREQSAKRRAALGATMQTAALMRMRGNEQENVKKLDLNDATLAEIVRAAEVGARIEALALGMPTDVLQGSVMISTSELGRVVKLVVEAALDRMEEDEIALFVMEVEHIARTGRRMT